MSQTMKSRKLVSELSRKYFRCRMRKLENCHSSMETAKRVKFQEDNNESDKSNETCENNNNTFHNMEIIDDNNESDELNSSNSTTNNVVIIDDNNESDETNSSNSTINNVVDDIDDICDTIENEGDTDFTPSHLAIWCKTLNIPRTHADALLKDIRKHKCFRTTFPSAIRTILGTPKSTQLKIVPPGEYYHKGLVNELVRVLSKHNIENVNLTLNIDGLPLFKSSGQQLWPILISVAGIPGEIMFIIMEKLLTMDKGLFYIIEFYDGIQIIPDKWVIEDEMLAYWPKVKSDKDFDTIVYTRSSIKDDWSLEPIKKILSKTDSFSNAKLKLKTAEYQSDIDSPYNTDEKKKQRRDNAKRQFSADEQQSRGRKRKIKPKKTNLPPLPEVPTAVASAATYSKIDVSDNSSSVRSASTHSKTYVSDNSSSVTSASTHSKTYVSDNSSSITSASTHNKDYVSDNSSIALAVMDKKSSSKNKELHTVVLSSHNKEVNHEIHQILRIVENLRVSINGLTSLIREIIQRLDTLEKNSESLKVQSVLDEGNTLEDFPIATAASLKKVESIIESNCAFKKHLITSLTQVTSGDIKKTIRNILHYLITDEMAKQYSWLGQRDKAAFQNLQISKILTLVVKMRHQDVTCEQISSVAAEWLKHAKQRAQRQSEKEKKYQKKETPPLSSNSDDSESDELMSDECFSNNEH